MITRKNATLAGFLFSLALSGCGITKNSKSDATPAAPAPQAPAKVDDACAKDVSAAYFTMTGLLNQVGADSETVLLEKTSTACDKFENMIRSLSCQTVDANTQQSVKIAFDSKIENACRAVKTNLAEARRRSETQGTKPPVVKPPVTQPGGTKPPVVKPPVTQPGVPQPTKPPVVTPAQPPVTQPSAPAQTSDVAALFEAKKDFKQVSFKILNADLLKKATMTGAVAEVGLVDGQAVRDIGLVTALDGGKVACWLELAKPAYKKDEIAASVKVDKDNSSESYHDVSMYLKFANGKIGILTCSNKDQKAYPTPKQIRAALKGALEIESFN